MGCRRVMEPDSEEMRRILVPRAMCFERKREWIMKGGEMADVALEEADQLMSC